MSDLDLAIRGGTLVDGTGLIIYFEIARILLRL